jgi:hypothetical protein
LSFSFEVVTFLDRDPAARIPESAGRAYLFCSVIAISPGIAQPTTIGAIHSGIVAIMKMGIKHQNFTSPMPR